MRLRLRLPISNQYDAAPTPPRPPPSAVVTANAISNSIPASPDSRDSRDAAPLISLASKAAMGAGGLVALSTITGALSHHLTVNVFWV